MMHSYHSKLVGVTFEGRQEIISMLKGDEPLQVRREPDNEFDKKAVAVDVMFGETFVPIGYIAKDKNKEMSEVLDAGLPVNIAISSLTGGNDKAHGVNVHIEYSNGKDDTSEEPVKAGPTVKYKSRLLGEEVELEVVGGHKRLTGYLSGSSFPNQFYPEFDEEEILGRMIEKHYKDSDNKEAIKASILAMWELNREASTGYGTAVHAALENYDKFFKLGDKLKTVKTFKTKADENGPNKALSRNPFISKIVTDFHEKFGGDYLRLTEEFVWLHDKKLCGSIDRVKIIDVDKKIIRIQDYKTDGDIHEKKYQTQDSPLRSLTEGQNPVMGKELLDLHWLQLSFYAYILEHYGFTVEGLDVYWLNPAKLVKGENAWEEFSHDVIDLKSII